MAYMFTLSYLNCSPLRFFTLSVKHDIRLLYKKYLNSVDIVDMHRICIVVKTVEYILTNLSLIIPPCQVVIVYKIITKQP